MDAAKSKVWIGMSGAVGAFMAVLADVIQKEHASSTIKIGDVLQAVLQIPFARMFAVLVVIGLAVAVCFIFECDTGKSAFYRGLSVLTILMTAVPYNAPPSVNTDPSKLASPAPAVGEHSWFRILQPASAFAGTPQPSPVHLRITLTTDDRKPLTEASITLAEPQGGGVVARSKMSGNRLDLYPAPGRYTLSVEAQGYEIARREITLEAGHPVQLEIPLRATWTPLSIQRLFRK